MNNRLSKLLLACAAVALLAAGCGNKGALYLPEGEARPEGAPEMPDNEGEAVGPDDQGDTDEEDDL